MGFLPRVSGREVLSKGGGGMSGFYSWIDGKAECGIWMDKRVGKGG